MTQKPRVRDANYDVLRQFIDDADNLRNFLMLCSATPKMCTDDQRGFPSHDPLWQRLGGLLGGVEGDYRAITVDLDKAPLSDDDLLELAGRLRNFHRIAYTWQADEVVPDEFLSQLIKGAKAQRGEIALPRFVAQATISLLEAKQQNPGWDLESLLPNALRDAVERIRQQERAQHRPWE